MFKNIPQFQEIPFPAFGLLNSTDYRVVQRLLQIQLPNTNLLAIHSVNNSSIKPFKAVHCAVCALDFTMAGESEAPAIGIDLGTIYSCVAVWRNDRVEIIPNDQGNRVTPSYVAFNETERLIGDAAKNVVAFNPTNTVFG